MSESERDPNEFARLMALPESHPDRVRALRDPEWASMALAYAAFESPASPDAGAAGSGREALRGRLAGEIARATVQSRPVLPPRPAGWFAGWAVPVPRAALALAGIAIVAGLAWWMVGPRSQPDVVRGVEDPGAFHLLTPRPGWDRLLLSWTAVPAADRYRIRFIGPDLAEVTHVDAGASTRYELRSGALPAQLAGGASVVIEVVALRGDDVVGTTPVRSIRLP